MSIPRSASRSSTFLSYSGYFTYIITTKRITAGDELKQRKDYATLLEICGALPPASSANPDATLL